MTKEGEDWFKKVCLAAKYVPEGAQQFEVAEFWIKAFSRELEQRAKSTMSSCYRGPNNPMRISDAYHELKDEIL